MSFMSFTFMTGTPLRKTLVTCTNCPPSSHSCTSLLVLFLVLQLLPDFPYATTTPGCSRCSTQHCLFWHKGSCMDAWGHVVIVKTKKQRPRKDNAHAPKTTMSHPSLPYAHCRPHKLLLPPLFQTAVHVNCNPMTKATPPTTDQPIPSSVASYIPYLDCTRSVKKVHTQLLYFVCSGSCLAGGCRSACRGPGFAPLPLLFSFTIAGGQIFLHWLQMAIASSRLLLILDDDGYTSKHCMTSSLSEGSAEVLLGSRSAECCGHLNWFSGASSWFAKSSPNSCRLS
jgi:hypothetical protein